MFAYVHLSMAFVGGLLLLAATDAAPAHARTTVIVCKGCVIVPDPEECHGCVVRAAPPEIVEACRGCIGGGMAALRPKPVHAGRMPPPPVPATPVSAIPLPAIPLSGTPLSGTPVSAAPVPAPVPGDRLVNVAALEAREAGVREAGARDVAVSAPAPVEAVAGDRLVNVAMVLGFPRADLDVGFARERRCLAEAIYFEARGEPGNGQRAVAQVVLNRVSDRRYPSTVCDVVFQNRERPNRCQFSFACDGRPEGIDDVRAWKRAILIAGEALSGRYFDESVGAATHYHAASVEPVWSRELLQIAQIGAHVFYRTGPPRQQEH